MRCAQCGFDNPAEAAACGQCGTPLSAGLTPADLERLRSYLASHLLRDLEASATPPPDLLAQTVTQLSRLYESLASHLPAFISDSVEYNPTRGAALGQFIDGTLLFADVSGFTAMSERLSRIGREGAEEITAIINRYFGAMLDILRAHDGQLIQFGGDALLCLFREPGSALRATRGALRMQIAMAEFSQIQTSQGVFPLQMKVGLHRGACYAAQLGSTQRMAYGLFGPHVNATAATESAAVAGQVVMDRASFAALPPGEFSAAPGRTAGYVSVTAAGPLAEAASPPLAAALSTDFTVRGLRELSARLDALAPYLPADLLTRFTGDVRAMLQEGEHRLVSMLFVNVHGLGEIADRLGPGQEARITGALNTYFVAMEGAIRRFGGVVNKIDLYDHGDKLLAFFGAPVAHEDDAERAVRAALAMQAELAEVNAALPQLTGLPEARVQQQIGISYGYVFAGYVGVDWRREYTVMGDEVNLAARLMSVAQPGTVIVPPAVYRKGQALFSLAPRGAVKLKGKAEPVSTFEVEGQRPEAEARQSWSGVRSPLVGRRSLRGSLQAAVERLLAGQGQVLSVIGEAGLGKSRLADEVRRQLLQAEDGARWEGRWIEGRCLSYTESASFWPFQEIVRYLAGIRQDDHKGQAREHLRGALQARLGVEAAAETLPYVANFLGLPLQAAEQERLRYLDSEALQRRTFVALAGWIETVARAVDTPLVLVLEDIHWIDQASRALLEHLLPLVQDNPLGFLLLYRPERDKACWQLREKISHDYPQRSSEVTLQPLEAGESRELLINLAQVAQWPPAMQDQILQRTEGNPLYMEELIRSLISEGALVQDEQGQWQLRRVELAVPDTLQGMMMARLDRLEEAPRQTAQVASVVGRSFPFDLLAYIQDTETARLEANLGQLGEFEIVYARGRRPELTYAFKHGMMQEVYYTSLLARTSRQYHRRIAEYLESHSSLDEQETNAAVIAHHAYLGQDWPRSLRYQMLAGRRSQKLFANADAVDHFSKALQSADNLPPAETDDERLVIYTALGELLTTTGQYEAAREHLRRALDLARSRVDVEAEAHACFWLARSHELRGEYPAALEWIERGLAALGGRETPDTVQLRLIAGLINIRQGNAEKGLEYCQIALESAERLGERAALARAYTLLGYVTQMRGDNLRAAELCQRSLELYHEVGHLQGQALAHNLIANALFYRSAWSEADYHYRQAHEIFDKMGDVYNQAMASSNLGGVSRNLGRLDEALAFYQTALRLFEQIGGAPYMQGGVNSAIGETFTRRGEVVKAREHFARSLELYRQGQTDQDLPELYRRMAEADCLNGQLTEARARGQQALNLAREQSVRFEEAASLRLLGEVSSAEGQPGVGMAQLQESLAIFGEVGDEYEAARTRLAIARLSLENGDPATAGAALGQSIPVLERLQAALDLRTARELESRLGA